MKKQVIFTKQAESFLMGLSEQSCFRVREVFKLLSERGFLRAPMSEKVAGQQGLFEVRVKDALGQYRVFYVYDNGSLIFALNGFVKKTARTPRGEIAKALSIRKELGL